METIVVNSLRPYHLGRETKKMIECGNWFLYTVTTKNKRVKYCISANNTLYFLTQRGFVVSETKIEPEGIHYINNIRVQQKQSSNFLGKTLNGYFPK